VPLEAGHVAYRPTGNALCLLFDAADEDGDEPLTRVGRIVEGAESCHEVRANQTLRVEAADG
jgi:hypothetical protein